VENLFKGNLFYVFIDIFEDKSLILNILCMKNLQKSFSLFLIFSLFCIHVYAQNNGNPAQQSRTAISNATKAKMPKGTLSFTVDGKKYTASENKVQCMFVSMGSPSMAQGMISGNGSNFSVSGIMMTAPKTGTLKGKGVAATTGMSIILNGKQYMSNLGGEITINIEKITPDGSNHYIGGTFNGMFKSNDGSVINVKDGLFMSGYL
jgi:hypothetical protein